MKVVQDTEKKFNAVKEQLIILEPQFKSLDQSRIQENDLNLIVNILKFSEEIKVLNERTQKGSEKVTEVETKRESNLKKITELTKSLVTLKEQKLDTALLSQIGNWFIQHKNLQKSLLEQTEKTEKQQKQVHGVAEELKVFPYHKNYQENFRTQKESLESNKKQWVQKLDHLKIQKNYPVLPVNFKTENPVLFVVLRNIAILWNFTMYIWKCRKPRKR